MMIEEGSLPANVSIPEGVVVESAITVYSFIGPDGNMHYGVYAAGELVLSTYVGLLELGKAAMIADADKRVDHEE